MALLPQALVDFGKIATGVVQWVIIGVLGALVVALINGKPLIEMIGGASISSLSILQDDVGGLKSTVKQNTETLGQIPPSAKDIPAGAVMAFDTTGQCPEGWSPFAEAQSRTIIGASFGISDPLFRGNLTQRKYRDHGGEETVTLTRAQMPTHSHALVAKSDENLGAIDLAPTNFIKQADASIGADPWYHLKGTTIGPSLGRSAEMGDSEPHNNMPPYIALYFCRKD